MGGGATGAAAATQVLLSLWGGEGEDEGGAVRGGRAVEVEVDRQ